MECKCNTHGKVTTAYNSLKYGQYKAKGNFRNLSTSERKTKLSSDNDVRVWTGLKWFMASPTQNPDFAHNPEPV
jgi:hypothetical protein